MYKIAKEKLPALFQLLANEQELILPIKNSGQVNFGLWDEEVEVDLTALNSVKSPKDAFFPQGESLYTCKKDGKKIEIQQEELRDKDFVIFGMRPCDYRGVEVLDKVFLVDPVDSYYQARREHGIIVTMACSEPEETCFCKVFDIDCADPKGDVAAWLDKDFLYWKPVTDKGKAITEKVSSLFAESDDKAVETIQEDIRSIVEKLPYSNLSLEGWGAGKTDEKFDSPIWESFANSCLACGTCTFICPTCQCYDIKDYNTGNSVERYRCWDSCMYSDFTMMAHGNNRTTQMQRFRQRFMHKLVYFPTNNDGMYSCVGCGRCVSKCPSSLNIVKVIKRFQEEGGKAN
ncbi:sulfhydrogenase subunit beta (sulfur reductase) [Aequitasia blattaphilus]|uniref:4Fe-4S dicluster domain-containing protein n=1 Tax=Aequitasia blattaphilus TaxID=2949332 RepID=A0ABT1EA19_9FIRM|nr:4Fe-4S dicluster domain-containing protein [Aequitasia blattaphilus]MCP1102668.1 4Fe-4S dicluster domain-containing protein [Aequitasia blattaphilus]MCR8615308.1 4Fe-4S dicluster domain-containing protein [Aequitasia blattaphilus]